VKLLNRRQLGEKGLPNSKAHIWRVSRDPDPELPFPQPIRIGRNTFWVEEEIDRYLAALVAKRDGQKGSAA
jgi:predicted DNA-binding transcriptional regulator AlpA